MNERIHVLTHCLQAQSVRSNVCFEPECRHKSTPKLDQWIVRTTVRLEKPRKPTHIILPISLLC